MNRLALLLGGLVLLGAAAVLRPAPAAGNATAALGRSMGGLRVMVVDALFLRAEAQRRAGRVEDAAALYRSVLDLDPVNEAAAAFLAATYVQNLMPQIPDPGERFGWWEEARTLLQQALARRPGAAGLSARLANLILDLPLADPELEAPLEAKLKRPRLLALRHLAAAARATGTLPRLGRTHLLRFAALAPDVAGQALAQRDIAVLEEVRDLAREVLMLRGPLMAEVRWQADRSLHLAEILRTGLAAVEATEAALAGKRPRSEAAAAIDLYDLTIPDTGLVERLRGLLRGR